MYVEKESGSGNSPCMWRKKVVPAILHVCGERKWVRQFSMYVEKESGSCNSPCMFKIQISFLLVTRSIQIIKKKIVPELSNWQK